MGILSSAGDFFGNAARRGKEIGSAAYDKAKSALGGEAKPGAYESFQENVGNARAAGLEGANSRTLGGEGLRSTAVSEAARAASPAGEPAPRMGFNERVDAGNQWAANKGGLRKVASLAGRAAGPLGAASEVYSAGSNIAAGENPVSAVGRSLLRGGATVLGGVGGAGLGTIALPGAGTLVGGVAGSAAGYKAGDALANRIFGPEGKPSSPISSAQAAPATAPQAAQPDVAVAPQAAATDSNYVDLLGGDRARPAVLTDSNVGVPVPGQGAFRRTTPGNEGTATRLGGPQAVTAAPQAPAAPAAPQGRDFVADTRQYGLRGASKLREQDIQDAGNKATLAATVAQRNLDLQKWVYEQEHTAQNENESRVKARTESYVRGRSTAPGGVSSALPGQREAYDNQVKQQTADLTDRLAHTASVTGQTIGKLPEAQHTLLLKANDLRDRMDVYRKSAPGFFQDFFGKGRFDSKNLYSYLPARDATGKAKPAIPETFGYSVEMGNGNKVKVYSLVNRDGTTGLNFTGPNDPVDADAMELMAPAIKAAQRAGKK